MNPNTTTTDTKNYAKTKEASHGFLADARESAGDMIKNVREKTPEMFRNAGSNLNGWIRQNPLQATIVAAGVGFALGAIVRRATRQQSS